MKTLYEALAEMSETERRYSGGKSHSCGPQRTHQRDFGFG